MKTSLMFAAAWLIVGSSVSAGAENNRNVALYNPNGLVAEQYDPISYYPEGGANPGMGAVNLALDYEGVSYRFQTEENLNTFKSLPERYEPTYGGWCAWGMRNNARIDVDTRFFTLHKGRLHLFVNSRAKRQFDSELQANEILADQNWKQQSGEEPRVFE